MWSISSLARKAQEAAALLEEQINDSIGAGDEADDAAGDSVGSDGDGQGGWEKCDGAEETDGGSAVAGPKPAPSSGMSFVDLKEASDIPKASGDEEQKQSDDSDALADALARIAALERQVSSLKMELASARDAAREESENNHATKLLMEQQIKELQEENKSLKENAADEN